MASTLITLLGRPPPDTGRGTAAAHGSYRKTRYRIESHETEPISFIGWALRLRFRIPRIVILGTHGSRWDLLLEQDGGSDSLGPDADALRLALMEKSETHQVTQALLDEVAPLVKRVRQCDVALQLVPAGTSETEQTAMLRNLAEVIHNAETIHLDLTHSFRHLSMLLLVSALHLRAVRRVRIARVWYGTYDEENPRAAHPTIDLSGLVKLADGVTAVSRFKQDGDCAAIASTLQDIGFSLPVTRQLQDAAFYERIHDDARAHRTIGAVRPSLLAEGDAITRLIATEVAKALDWAADASPDVRQARLALKFFRQRDYFRAALYGSEALVTRACLQGNLPIDQHILRDEASKSMRKTPSPQRRAINDLMDLRNLLAHGRHGSAPTSTGIESDTRSEDRLRAKLQSLFAQLGIVDG